MFVNVPLLPKARQVWRFSLYFSMIFSENRFPLFRIML
jgi:hypothetical protein